MKKSIELDFCAEGRPVATELVAVRLLQERGAGGGNPLYELTGEVDDLRAFLVAIDYGQHEDIDMYLSR